ncbi:hypothetical protein WJX73_010288 [Symbiochloris irregularis]|uniref:TNase-like domain-containing protein n=1 Tax=Symbiochloris irregularis TaxID=706552 RepID=A0AAW1P6T7_9CHLO
MASGWMPGTVVEVPSGDTVVIAGPADGGSELEKRIRLSSLVAPQLGNRVCQSAEEEPFAWQSKEFLRQLCIGQACTFKVDYTVDGVAAREFGSVFIGHQPLQNVALEVAAKGWARVRTGGGLQSPYHDQLVKASELAEGSSLGLFNKADNAPRKIPAAAQGTGVQQLLDQHGKGKELLAIVEQAPFMGQSASAASPTTKPATAGTVERAAADAQSEPFAREAKQAAKSKALNREVHVTLEGVDKLGHILGSVCCPPAAGEATDLALHLVQHGLAQVDERADDLLPPAASQALRAAEQAARHAQKGMWHSWTAPAGNSSQLCDNFTGIVREVVSGDLLVVADSASGVSRRITLSSVRSPRIGRQAQKPEPWAIESKEFLRCTVIGKEVSVSLEHSHTAGGAKVPGQQGDPVPFGTVTIHGCNVAELMLAQGLSTVAKHRADAQRSAQYDALVKAEQAAMQARKGVFSGREAPLPHIIDVSTLGNPKQAKQFLPFLLRSKRQGIVVSVQTGHSLRILISAVSCLIDFTVSGVHTPAAAPRQGRDAVTAEQHSGRRYGEEATAFTYAHVQQREVQIEVTAMDRRGTFLGSLVVPGSPQFNLGSSLLKAGLAWLDPSLSPAKVGAALAEAQAEARRHKVQIWSELGGPWMGAAGGVAAGGAASAAADLQAGRLTAAGKACVQEAAPAQVQKPPGGGSKPSQAGAAAGAVNLKRGSSGAVPSSAAAVRSYSVAEGGAELTGTPAKGSSWDAEDEGLSPNAQLVLSLLPEMAQPPPTGNRLCIDFIGCGVSLAQLLGSLSALVPDLLACETVKQQLEPHVGQSRAGWAVLTFRHHKDAVEAYQKLRHIYWKTDTCPIPRPLLVHWPRKRPHLSADPAVEVYGYVSDLEVPPHFAQPNSIEYVPAIQWRHHLQSQATATRLLHRQHIQELSDIMAQYVEDADLPCKPGTHSQCQPYNSPTCSSPSSPHATQEASIAVSDESVPAPALTPENGEARETGEVKGSSFLWLKGVSKCALLEAQVFENAFEQWGVVEVRKLQDPALGEYSGHVLIRLRTPAQAECVNADLSQMVYLLGGTPRLVTSRVARPGMPEMCRQNVYDSALGRVFRGQDHGKPEGDRLTLVSLPRPSTLEELYAVRLRARLEHQDIELAEVRSLGRQTERRLSAKHEACIDAEMRKFIELRGFTSSRAMRYLLGIYGRQDGQSWDSFFNKLPPRYRRMYASPAPPLPARQSRPADEGRGARASRVARANSA